MGIKKDEECFPRGRSSSSKPALRRTKDTLFKKHKRPKKKAKKNTFLAEIQGKVQSKQSSQSVGEIKHVIRPLTYQTLEEGMVVVGRIREILPFHMFICLPGRLSAKVPVAAISEPYTESLAKLQDLEISQQECPPLSELFRIGQTVVCSIVEVKKDRDLLAVSVSLDPQLVNKDRAHHTVQAGQMLVAAVRSVEDHGYTLHSGIGGLTTFLRTEETTNYVEQHNLGRPLVVGEVLRCLVTKCTTSRSVSRAEVTVNPESVAQAVLSDVSPQTLHPATTVRCIVQQVLTNGLAVSIGRSHGYVETSQLFNCWHLSRNYTPKTELTATVIYTMPHIDFQTSRPVYLTLKPISDCVSPSISIGEVLEAKVAFSGPKGVSLCLGEKKDNELGNKGFVSIRRLGENIDKELVANKFPKGKKVTTRILSFDYMEQVYNCSLERAQLDLQYVRPDQLHVGDRVSCEVVAVDDNGLRLAIGPIRLYAFKEHSADVPYKNLYQHFFVGDIVDGRVLKVTPETRGVIVTLKETLIRGPALTSYEAAQVHHCYWGIVRFVRDTSLYITFYNDTHGSASIAAEKKEAYYPGQLVKCYVTYVNPSEEKMLLSLTPKETVEPHLTVGEFCQLVVTQVLPDCLVVSACDFMDVDGMVPTCHLPNNNACREGDFLKAWLFLVKGGTYHFSPNPLIKMFFKAEENIKPRLKVTCCVSSVSDKKITVYTPLQDFPVVEIPKKKWTLQEDIVPYQIVKLYVEHFDSLSKTLTLATRKPSVNQDTVDKSDLNVTEDQSNVDYSNNASSLVTKEKSEHSKVNNEVVEECLALLKKKKNESVSVDTPFTSSEKENSPKKKKKKEYDIEQLVNKSSPEMNKQLVEEQNLPPKRKIKETENDTIDSIQSLVSIKRKANKSVSDMKSETSVVALEETNSLKKKKKKESDQPTISSEINKQFDLKNDQNQCTKKRRKIVENDITDSGKINNEESKDSVKKDVTSKKGKKKSAIANNEKIPEDNLSRKKEKRKPSNETDFVEQEPVEKIEETKKTVKAGSNKDNESTKKAKKRKKDSIQTDLKRPTLSETGFLWDIKPEDLNKPVEEPEEDDEDVEESSKGKKKKTTAERRRAAKEEEARLREVEQSLLDSESNPQSADQFDRAVLARPDDADLWIKYMSYHLQATEIEKARAVARRALQTINTRHEVERLNVWIALLNLENLFGNQESLKNTLDEALRTNDEFTVYCKMLQIYSQANKAQEVEQLVGKMLHKFRTSSACWVHCCSCLMQCGLSDKARIFLQRAITALPTKEHVNLLCKFALLENQYGFCDQAQTLFEHILTSYPKRLDVWIVYVDMLVKTNKIPVVRQILERATRQKLPPRKMKALFSKWVSFEEKHGTSESVEHVRKQALNYVNNITMKLE